MKQTDYHHILLLSTLIELLIERRVVSYEEIVRVMQALDREMPVTLTQDIWLKPEQQSSR